jgi:hypothetical protein
MIVNGVGTTQKGRLGICSAPAYEGGFLVGEVDLDLDDGSGMIGGALVIDHRLRPA